MVVLPAASRPTIRILCCERETKKKKKAIEKRCLSFLLSTTQRQIKKQGFPKILTRVNVGESDASFFELVLLFAFQSFSFFFTMSFFPNKRPNNFPKETPIVIDFQVFVLQYEKEIRMKN
jgi:hypothetical protein